MTETAGEQFVRAFTARDRNGLRDPLADSIDLRGLTPRRYWEGTTSREVVDEVLLGHWLDESDHVTELIPSPPVVSPIASTSSSRQRPTSISGVSAASGPR